MGFFGAILEYIGYMFWALVPTKLRPANLLGAAQVGTDEWLKQVRFRKVLVATRWTLHVLIVLGVVVVLLLLNRFLDLDRVLRSPWPPLHYVWLPLLFLLAYALFWLGWWLLKLLGAEPEAADFPDIARAWAEAQQALRAEGVDPTEAPLFLVVGPAGGGRGRPVRLGPSPMAGPPCPQRRGAPARLRRPVRRVRHLRGGVAAGQRRRPSWPPRRRRQAGGGGRGPRELAEETPEEPAAGRRRRAPHRGPTARRPRPAPRWPSRRAAREGPEEADAETADERAAGRGAGGRPGGKLASAATASCCSATRARSRRRRPGSNSSAG